MVQLTERRCTPCRGGTPPLKGEAVKALMTELDKSWRVINDHHLEREFRFKDFKEALGFANSIGQLAEEENHHPEICLGWGRVKVTLFTHKIGGLSENDFILAAKIDQLPG